MGNDAEIRSREISACLVLKFLQAQSHVLAIYKDNADRT